MKDGWELRWEAKGEMFSATLYLPNGEAVDNIATKRKPGPGSTFYPKGGTYFLRIISGGDWKVMVVQLP